MGRVTARVDCAYCSHEFYVTKSDIRNIGLPWHTVWVAPCPKCKQFNIVHSEKRECMGDLFYESKYDKQSTEIITVVRTKEIGRVPEIVNQIKNDKVMELYVQLYVKENPEIFGLENLIGPFPSGPDFKGIWKGEKVEIEVERTYTNYKQHKHHMNLSFRKVSILICLDHKKPTQKSMEGLPKNIWYIDHQHFLEWYSNYLEEDAHRKSFRAVTNMIIGWIQSRLMEEEVGFENSLSKFTFEEYRVDISTISNYMAYEFIKPYFEKMKEVDFSYNELDALKLVDFYLTQKDKYLETDRSSF